MEEILNAHGAVAICIILTAHLLFKVVEFLWSIKEKRDQLSEATVSELVKTVQRLDATLHEIKGQLSDLPKFKKDMNRCWAAVKEIAGDKWPAIRRVVMDEEISP
jgi:hypothetical protein